VTRLLLVLVALAAAAPPTRAVSYAVLVAPRDTEAHAFAEATANGQTVFAERTLWRGLNKAAEILNGGGEHTVMVLIAEGTYEGQFGQGVWKVPAIDNPSGTLRILGGYTPTFAGRQPFGLPVRLQTVYGRDGALLQFERGSALRELVVSGLLLDAAPSNRYDRRTNSLLKGESRHETLLELGRIATERLIVVDNVFLNGDRRALNLTWAPASPSATVEIANNVFLNNLMAMETKIYPRRITDQGARLTLRHNSFLLNWPYNPDPTSSNVSAVELYHADSFREVVVERNLFAYNPGGAFQHDWPEDRMPALTIRENLFYLNGALWGNGAAGGAVIAGKFGTNPIYRVLDLGDVEDDLSATVEGNVAFDPEIPVALLPLQGVDSGSVQAQPTVINQVRSLFGANLDGGTVAIANFAPALSYDPRLAPLPRNEAAKAYGVQPARLYGATAE
jgi:hypothetical protein